MEQQERGKPGLFWCFPKKDPKEFPYQTNTTYMQFLKLKLVGCSVPVLWAGDL